MGLTPTELLVRARAELASGRLARLPGMAAWDAHTLLLCVPGADGDCVLRALDALDAATPRCEVLETDGETLPGSFALWLLGQRVRSAWERAVPPGESDLEALYSPEWVPGDAEVVAVMGRAARRLDAEGKMPGQSGAVRR